jgi:PEP-CTERM motif
VIGQGGAAFAEVLTVIGAPWTTGTAVLPTGETMMGARHGAGSVMSHTAFASGQLQLVTPVVVYTNIPGIGLVTYGTFGVLLMHFIPEPATFVLLGSGVVALAVAGRRKRSG